jgi:hypothetical protein
MMAAGMRAMTPEARAAHPFGQGPASVEAGMATTTTVRVKTEEDADKHATRNVVLLLIAVFVVAGYAIEFGPQTLVWLEGKHWASVNPWLLEVPAAAPTAASATASAAKGTEVKAYNYEFNAPWALGKITPSLNFVQVRFAPGQVVVFFDPEVQLDTLRVLRNSNPLEYQKFSNLFAGHPIETNYALYESVYGASPAQLSPFLPAADALRMNTLLQWKLSFGDEGGPTRRFAFGDLRGFEFGEPGTGKPVSARVFNERDRQFRFLFNVAAGTGAKITQDDIDLMISTLRPVPILER